MWSRSLLALAAGSLYTMTLFRHELQDLADSVRTYAAFHSHLERHQELLYRFPSNPGPDRRKDGDNLVPPILHRIDLSEDQEDSTLKFEDAISSCHTLHSNWTHMLWTDQNATQFMRSLYPDLLAGYEGYTRSIEYTNVLKYALLEHYGGVYLNLDIACIQPLDELRQLPFLTPGAYPVGVSKAIMLSRPRHPFLRRLLEGLERRNSRRRLLWIDNILNTGSMFFSNSWMSYARLLAIMEGESVPEEKRVYILADEHGNLRPHVLGTGAISTLFHREGASSWRDWDNAVLVTVISKHYQYFLAMMGLGAVCTTVWLWAMSRRRRRTLIWVDFSKESKELEKIDDGEKLLVVKGG